MNSPITVGAAKRALMEEMIDYAGLFPPAELAMLPAVMAYAGYREGERSWALGRFVLALAWWRNTADARGFRTPWVPVFPLLGIASCFWLTLGLPIIRTSPDHGTALEIAGQGKADHRSMLAAVQLACRLAAQATNIKNK